MNNAIVVDDLHKAYGSVKALNGVSLTAEAGRVLGLLGPNGAGKTTIVRILTTLLKPDSGQASVAGVDVLKNPEHARHVFGLAGQYPAVDPQLTGRENLHMVARLYHFSAQEAKSRARELLTRFTLEEAADRPVKTYSGGMRRRLDLAAAIVARPPVLFLDEPTTGLDPRTRKDLWEFIRELVRDGATLLLTTQYLEEADTLADRIVLIDEGLVKAEGTPAELKSRFSSDVLEMRLENDTQITHALDILRSVNGHQPTHDDQDNLIRLPVDHGAQSLLKAVRALDEAKIVLADVALRQPTLDDVFLNLTKKTAETA
ncbi:MAG: daunorubicin resistance protein DrrA family ABC transporter ATP-binding protein [Anaerolineae bacterium]